MTTATDAAAPPEGGDASGLTPEQAEEMIRQQKEVSEHVDGLEEQLERVRVTYSMRITDLGSEQFTVAGPKAERQWRCVVEESAEAVKQFAANGNRFSAAEAKAVVVEFVMAINNNLLPNIDTECLFGVAVPNMEVVDAICHRNNGKGSMFSGDVLQETLGLIVYRAWQVMLRTPRGRATLMEEAIKEALWAPPCRKDAAEDGAEEAANAADTETDASQDKAGDAATSPDPDSFDNLTDLLATCLNNGTLTQLFAATLKALPTTRARGTQNLLSIERSVITAGLNDKTLAWSSPRV